MTFTETLLIALIPSSFAALASIVSVVINYLMNYKRARKEVTHKDKIAMRDRVKNDIAGYMSKIQQCYYDSAIINRKPHLSDYNLFSQRASEVIGYGYKIKLELNPVRDKVLSEKIDEINDFCASFNIEKIKTIKLQELYNLGYITLAAMDTEIKKMAS